MKRSIHHTFIYPHPKEVVWDYLTKSDLIAQWLMANDFKPVVGHEFNFHTKPMPQFGFDGIVYCKVMEIIPYKKLIYSWKGGKSEAFMLDTVVVWTLTAKDTGTELSLDHSGFDDEKNAMALSIMDMGWQKNIQEINELINHAINATPNS